MEKLLAYIYSLTCKKKNPDIMYNPPRRLHVSCQSYPRYESNCQSGWFIPISHRSDADVIGVNF